MSLTDKMTNFEYEAVPKELGITSRDHLRAKLEAAAAEQRSCEEAQMIHDVSWVLTQLMDEDREYLSSVRREIAEVLRNAYGPFVFDCGKDIGLNLENLILPLAKEVLGDRDSRVGGFILELILGAQAMVPSPKFATIFAKLYFGGRLIRSTQQGNIKPSQKGTRVRLGRVKKCRKCNNRGVLEGRIDSLIEQAKRDAKRAAANASSHSRRTRIDRDLIGKILGFIHDAVKCNACDGSGVDIERLKALPSDPEVLASPWFSEIFTPAQRGYRVDVQAAKRHFGEKVKCKHCNGSGVNVSKCEAVLSTPLPGNPRKKIRDLLNVFAGEGGIALPDLLELFGEDILCPYCIRFLDVPANAQDGWICPSVDGQGNHCEWMRIRLDG